MADCWKKKFCSKIWWFLAWKNYIFHSIIKLEGHCIEKQIHNKLKKDWSQSDDFLSSYSCSKFEKCSFKKNAFKDKSRQSPNNNLAALQKPVTQKLFEISTWNFNVIFEGTSYPKMQKKKSKFSKYHTSRAP